MLTDCKKKQKKIPEENLIQPKVNILGPVMEGLKYNLDEEHIKEMFTNILLSDMDSRKQSRVKPAYIEIVKQLSKEDAEFLKGLKLLYLEKDILPIITLKAIVNNTNSFFYVSNKIICLNNHPLRPIDPVVLDNLLRLKILDIPFDSHVSDTVVYENAFNQLITQTAFEEYNDKNNRHLGFKKEILKCTDFGKNFIDICLS